MNKLDQENGEGDETRPHKFARNEDVLTFITDVNSLKAYHHYQLLIREHNMCDAWFFPSRCLLSNEKSKLWAFCGCLHNITLIRV